VKYVGFFFNSITKALLIQYITNCANYADILLTVLTMLTHY